MAPQNSLSLFAAGLLLLSGVLLALAVPMAHTAWQNAPPSLDHNRAQTKAETFAAQLAVPSLTTQERANIIQAVQRQAARTPGDSHVWYVLAAALEPVAFTSANAALFDHALSMSILTAPFARDLALPRAALITRHWGNLSADLQNLWQETTIRQWGNDPEITTKIYQSLSPGGQQILADTLGEVPNSP